MSRQTIDDTVASIQQTLDQDYAHLEWRVLASSPMSSDPEAEPFVYVHARPRDVCYCCRIGRPWSMVLSTPTLRLLETFRQHYNDDRPDNRLGYQTPSEFKRPWIQPKQMWSEPGILIQPKR